MFNSKIGKPVRDGKTIMVIDPDRLVGDLVEYNFDQEGYRVKQVYSLDDAYALDLSQYSLFILDMDSAEHSVLQFIETMRSDAATVDTPIIICSDAATSDYIVDCLNAGADDFVIKPFSMRVMLARVKSVLSRH